MTTEDPKTEIEVPESRANPLFKELHSQFVLRGDPDRSLRPDGDRVVQTRADFSRA